eukprot:7497582-Lingulodinium_polyedra.AAC.1
MEYRVHSIEHKVQRQRTENSEQRTENREQSKERRAQSTEYSIVHISVAYRAQSVGDRVQAPRRTVDRVPRGDCR